VSARLAEPDAFCKHCGRGMVFRRKGGRVYRREFCNGRCRKAYWLAKQSRHGSPSPPASAASLGGGTPDPLPENLQSYSQREIITWLERSRLPNNIKMDLWEDWKRGQIPLSPRTVNHVDESVTQLIQEADEKQIVAQAAIFLARKGTKDRARTGAP